jgi:hypothetical protein
MTALILNWRRAYEARVLSCSGPAVVTIPDILGHIKDGETLTVDGDVSTVERVL